MKIQSLVIPVRNWYNKQKGLEARVQKLEQEIKQLMATKADFDSRFDRLDAATANIAKQIADLKAQIAAGGMTAAEEDAAVATLESKTAALEALTQ